ncbi:MAG TPA: DmsC/YnfH family molybdoenzyme membrane anchor subunit [Acidimicrobiales bacterium]|jgi:DMSO reductase iron-sulfur subunit|nr:DmsC/YnfH family molybdoenzyme membrane anchor subunit [Acidimicrobiales bacterium]
MSTAVAITRKRDAQREPHGVTDAGPALLPLDAGQQYRFTFNMSACIGCHACEVACAEQNNLPVEVSWRRVGDIEGGAYPHTKRFHLSMACNHCLEPACLEGCPTLAYVKLPNGVVEHHADDCIGCQYCTWNCPYSVPVFQPDRKIVTKCDMCLPRLEAGQTPACVGACPTRAIGVEAVDVEAWRLDHGAADGPHLPPSDITLSTTRLILPADLPAATFAASDYTLQPEHPHWPLVWVTLLTQLAMGIMAGVVAQGADRPGSLAAFVAASVALPASLFHLGRPLVAYKALRGLRRSWLSREVLAFSVFAAAAGAAAVAPSSATAIVALAVGLIGVYSSGRLYVVPGRPAWNSPLTIVQFLSSAVALGPLTVGLVEDGAGTLRALAVVGSATSLAAYLANLVRLATSDRFEWRGTWVLTSGHLRAWFALRVVVGVAAVACSALAPLGVAFAAAVLAEAVGRWLFYVSVVPLNMPGGFFRGRA